MDTNVMEVNDADNDDDIPDDFFDDFANVEFIEGLNVIDSWEPPPIGDTNVSENLNDSDSSILKQDSTEIQTFRQQCKNEPGSYRKFNAPIRKYKESPVRNTESPLDRTRDQKTYRLSNSNSRDSSYRRRSRDRRVQSRQSKSRWSRRSRSRNYYGSGYSDKFESKTRSRTRSRSRIQRINQNRITPERDYKRNFDERQHHSNSSSSFSPYVPYCDNSQNNQPSVFYDPVPYQNNMPHQMDSNVYPQYDTSQPMINYDYPNQQYFVNNEQYMQQSAYKSNNYNRNLNYNTSNIQAIPPQKAPTFERKGPLEEHKDQLETEAKKLFAEKKLSLSEFLTMSAKRPDSTKESNSVENKVKILSRCNEALEYLKDLEEFPKKFIFNEKRYADFPRVLNPTSKFCSPLRKTQVYKFRFTTMPDALIRNKTQRIRTLIKSMNVKFNDYFKNNTEQNQNKSTSDKLSKLSQTENHPCETCEKRSQVKYKDGSCQVDVDELKDFASRAFKSLQRERFMTKRERFMNNAGTSRNGIADGEEFIPLTCRNGAGPRPKKKRKPKRKGQNQQCAQPVQQIKVESK